MSRLAAWFAVAITVAACTTTERPLAESTAVLSMHDFMKKVIDPAANEVFAAGNAEDASKVSPAQWKATLTAAGVLRETGRLLLVAPRANLDPEWTRTAQLLVDSGADATAAAVARDHNAAFEAGGKLYESCNSCHSKFVHGKT